jgi:hypothetical protein
VLQRTLVNADDVAAVLHYRVDRWIEAHEDLVAAAHDLIAGLLPSAGRAADPELARGITEREQAIEHRAENLAEQAAAKILPWICRLGQPPTDPGARREWLQSVATVAAYRDRWGIKTDLRPLGSSETVTSVEQYDQRKRALAAAKRAIDLSRGPQAGTAVAAALSSQIDQERGIEL